ncbi:MAG: hypothetical protein QXK47_02345 [Candidatus Bathyarchaeia archaeon]
MKKFQGETVSFYIYFKDEQDAPFDPDTVEAKLYKPDGSLAETLTVSRVDTGKYMVAYSVAEDAELGDWHILVKAVKGSFVEKERIPVTVCKPL